jgi:hypothetical protein
MCVLRWARRSSIVNQAEVAGDLRGPTVTARPHGRAEQNARNAWIDIRR